MIELLIVVAILTIVGAFSIPFMQTSRASTDLGTVTDQLSQTLRRAQLQARAGQNNADWGVYLDGGGDRYILFRGESYASRDSAFDTVFEYPSYFSAVNSLSDEVIFFKYSGAPSASGTIDITDEQSGGNRAVRINELGMVSHD